eukprot:3286723-Rhodomonas_salina.1
MVEGGNDTVGRERGTRGKRGGGGRYKVAEACPTAGGADQVTGDQIRGERAEGQEKEVERGNDTVGRRGNARE